MSTSLIGDTVTCDVDADPGTFSLVSCFSNHPVNGMAIVDNDGFSNPEYSIRAIVPILGWTPAAFIDLAEGS